MIVTRRGVRGVGVDGERGFEMLKIAFVYTISAFLGLGFVLGIFCKPA